VDGGYLITYGANIVWFMVCDKIVCVFMCFDVAADIVRATKPADTSGPPHRWNSILLVMKNFISFLQLTPPSLQLFAGLSPQPQPSTSVYYE